MVDLSGYIALFRIGIKNQLAYKADYVVYLLFRISRPLIMLAVWTAIYLNTGASTIGGLTLAGTSAYFFLVMPVSVAINESMTDTMQDDVQSGAVASARVKPMGYPLNVLARSLAVSAADIVLLTLPLLAITFLAFRLAPPPLSLFLFLIEVLVGIATLNLIGFFIGTMAVRLTNVAGLASAVWTVLWMLSGGMMPLSFFPTYAQNLLALTPIPIWCYLPVSTLLGTLSDAQIVSGILYTVAWAVALAVLAYVWWKRISKSMGSAGG